MRFWDASVMAKRCAFPTVPRGITSPSARRRGSPATEREGTTVAQKSNNLLPPPGCFSEQSTEESTAPQRNQGSGDGMGAGQKAAIRIGTELAQDYIEKEPGEQWRVLSFSYPYLAGGSDYIPFSPLKHRATDELVTSLECVSGPDKGLCVDVGYRRWEDPDPSIRSTKRAAMPLERTRTRSRQSRQAAWSRGVYTPSMSQFCISGPRAKMTLCATPRHSPTCCALFAMRRRSGVRPQPRPARKGCARDSATSVSYR